MRIPRALLLALLVALVGSVPIGSGTAAAAETVEGAFEGKTEQGYVVSFEVKERAVFNLAFTVKWGFCGTSPVHIRGRAAEIDSGGHFLLDEGQWKFDGTFVSPTEVQGTATFLEHPLVGCPEKVVPYTAHLRTGPPPAVPECTMHQLRISLYPRSPGASVHFLYLRLANRGSLCGLEGFPRLRLLGAGGRPLPTHDVHEGRAHRVRLEPYEAAVSTVLWDPGPGHCAPVPRGVQARIPGAIRRRLPWPWGPVCERGALRITAFK